MMRSCHDDLMLVASSTLCNLLLDFSPSKEPIVGEGALPLLVNLTRHPRASLRLNGIWGLMVRARNLPFLVSLANNLCFSPQVIVVWGRMV